MHGARAYRFCTAEELQPASSFMWMMLLMERRAGVSAPMRAIIWQENFQVNAPSSTVTKLYETIVPMKRERNQETGESDERVIK